MNPLSTPVTLQSNTFPAALTPFQMSSQTTSEDPYGLSTHQQELTGILEAPYTAYIITNQWMPNATTTDSFCITVSETAIALDERKSLQQLHYRYDLKEDVLTLNGQRIDQGYMTTFLEKLSLYRSFLLGNKAKVYLSETP